MASSIKISGITFTAINKWINHDTYQHITFTSLTPEGISKELSAYKSKSDMGYWRLFVYLTDHDSSRYYKGKPNDVRLPDGRMLRGLMGVDYVQQSFIHLKLQEYFNQVLISLPEGDTKAEYKKYEIDRWDNGSNPVPNEHALAIQNEIDREDRMEKIEPFYSYFLNVENRCAVVGQNRDENLLELSNKLKTIFPSIGKPELVYKDYIFNDIEHFETQPTYQHLIYGIPFVKKSYDDTIILKSDIYKVKLGDVNDKEVFLHFMLHSLNTKVSGTNNIEPLDIKNKLAPVSLTTSDDCTPFGVNAKYVLSGNYICKILDYQAQCLSKNKKCTHKYSYLGQIYANIFPYMEPNVQALVDLKNFQKHNQWLAKAHIKRVAAQAAGRRTRRKNRQRQTTRKKR